MDSDAGFPSTTRAALAARLSSAWPQPCAVCGTHSRKAICASCAEALPRCGESCPVCALPSPDAQVCGRCLRRTPRFDDTRAVFRYEFPLREVLLGFKHGQNFALQALFSAELCRLQVPRADCLVPMPLHPSRIAERGFNQSVEIASALARQLGIPLWRDAVQRDTPHGREGRLLERRRRVRGAFRCTRDFTGLRVLVVDDVMTSGATLEELARALKQRGARTVHNVVLARTPRRPAGR